MYILILFCRKFSHPNIVKILAVCVDNDPVFIIMELMPAGDLLKFLRDARPETVSLHVRMSSIGQIPKVASYQFLWLLGCDATASSPGSPPPMYVL